MDGPTSVPQPPTRGNQIPATPGRLLGVKSLRPTWFEDETVAKAAAEPMHGLRLIIKEDVLPISDYPKFEAIAEVAKRGLLAPETWHCNRPYINLKTTIDVPLLGTVIEQNVKLCTAKLCLENQNKTYRDQSYPKAFPQINKRESNFPCSLAQITPDNKKRFNTHSVSLARA